MDILLDTETHDIVFNNSIAVTTEGRQGVAQRLKIRLSTFLGEWFLDTSIGIPYHQRLLTKGVTKDICDYTIQSAILEDEDVVRIEQYNSTFDKARRYYSAEFRVVTTKGLTDVITVEV